MGKIRLYNLAKELGIESKELIVKLRSKGVMVKSALSSVDKAVEDAAKRIVNGDVAVVAPSSKKSSAKKDKASSKVSSKSGAKHGDKTQEAKKHSSKDSCLLMIAICLVCNYATFIRVNPDAERN